MAITFKFVNLFELYSEAMSVIDNFKRMRGVNKYNLFGYWGASGIGKTMLLNAISLYLQDAEIDNCIIYDCMESENYDTMIKFLNQDSKQPGIAIIDQLEELEHSKSTTFISACDDFINKNIAWRAIFCASRLPDNISQLLRPEQRLITQLGAFNTHDTMEMIDQIFPNLSKKDKNFLIEYAEGYPQMISIFCCLLKKQNRELKSLEIRNRKEFLRNSLIELTKSLNPDLNTSEEIERFLKRLCYLSLFEGFL
ncbi:MAG: hypothetical protein GF353_12905, partial [Candidatus Lokiarchaeota archaeon]|nr:hypothetical protein [Candidatus Lokiarchaeota archaeon]